MTKFVGEGAALEAVKEHLPEGYSGDGRDEGFIKVAERPAHRSDDEYFENPPEVIK